MSQPIPFDPDAPASGDGLFGLPFTPEEAAVVVVPVPFEATTSYRRGTKGAPEAVLAASGQVDLHDLETLDAWKAGIAMEEVDPRITAWEDEASALSVPVIEAGGLDEGDALQVAAVTRVNAISAALNALVEEKVGALFDAGRIPAVLGGDHAVPFGAMAAATKRYPKLGILHVDAHADLRRAFEGFEHSHASIFYNVRTKLDFGALVQVGIRDVGTQEIAFAESRDDVFLWSDPQIAWELAGGEPWRRLCARIIEPLPDEVWISFDIDGLQPDLCPGTGTPVPGGLSWQQTLVLLRVLAESGRRIVGFDLCEVGSESEWDAIVGARLLYKLAGWAITTRAR